MEAHIRDDGVVEAKGQGKKDAIHWIKYLESYAHRSDDCKPNCISCIANKAHLEFLRGVVADGLDGELGEEGGLDGEEVIIHPTIMNDEMAYRHGQAWDALQRDYDAYAANNSDVCKIG